MVSLNFSVTYFLPTVPWPWGRLSPYWKWVPGAFPGGKGGRYAGLTTSTPSCAESHEIWEPKPTGTLWATPGLIRDCFTFTFTFTYLFSLFRKIRVLLNHKVFGWMIPDVSKEHDVFTLRGWEFHKYSKHAAPRFTTRLVLFTDPSRKRYSIPPKYSESFTQRYIPADLNTRVRFKYIPRFEAGPSPINNDWYSTHAPEFSLCIYQMDQDSSDGMATRNGLDGPGIESRWGRDIPHPSSPALWPTQPHIQWTPGLSRG